MAKGNNDVDKLKAAYEEAKSAWESAHDAGFPDDNRDELKQANDEAFEAWDHAVWVKTQTDAGFTIAEDGISVVEGPPLTVYDDTSPSEAVS